MTQYLKLYGETLVELGYTVLPIRPGTKRPDIKDWPRHATTVADVRAWYSNGRSQHGVGINARNTPAIDVDVLDVHVADEMSRAIDEIFPGVPLMTRTGLAPKFLIPFRSDEPFKKLTSTIYTDGTHEHKVEILGDGQQWVAYHVHPDSGQPYAWFDGVGDDGIRGVPTRELPHLDRALAQRVIDAFEALAAKQVVAGRWHAVSAAPAERADRLADDPFASEAPPTDLTREQVQWVLNKLPNADLDYDRWFNVMSAVHHQLGEDGEELVREWSSASGKHTDEKFNLTWNSLGRYTGPLATMRVLLKETGQPPRPAKPLDGEFVQAARFATEQRVEWCVKHVLPKNALTIIYGEPGSGKSFFALDLVAHVARGLAWRGQKVRQGAVAYVAAEGVAGFGNRLQAYGVGHDVDLSSVPLYVRGGLLQLVEQQLALCEALEKVPDLAVVVIDTLAAVTPGANENSSEDMGAAINAANMIIQATGAAVILIHHTNKQATMRGWSGLLGAADSSIKIERDEEKRTAYIEKMKEGKDSADFNFKLESVSLGEDEDGDEITSCVIRMSDERAQKGKKRERKSRSGDFETSDNYIKPRRHLEIIEGLFGLDQEKISVSEAIAAIQADPILNPSEMEDTPPARSIKRTLHTLGEHGKLYVEDGYIRLGTR